MRFWGKNKYGEKKNSREKLSFGGESLEEDYGETGPLLGEEGKIPGDELVLIFHLKTSFMDVKQTKALYFFQVQKTCPAVLI